MSGGSELWDDALALPVASPLGEPLDPFDAEVVERLGLAPAPSATPAEPGPAPPPLGAPPPFGGDGQADPSEEYGAPEISGEFVVVGEGADTPPPADAADLSLAEGAAVETPLGADVHLVVEPTRPELAAFDPVSPSAGAGPSHAEPSHAESPLAPPAPSPAPPVPDPLAPSPAEDLGTRADAAPARGEGLAGAPLEPMTPSSEVPEPAAPASPAPGEGLVGAPLEPMAPESAAPVETLAADPGRDVPDAAEASTEPARDVPDATGESTSAAAGAATEVVVTGPSLFIPRLIRVVDEVGVPAAGDEGAEIEEVEEVIEEVDVVEAREDTPAEPAEPAEPVPPAPPGAVRTPPAPPPQPRRRRKHWADTVFGDAYPSLEPEGIGRVAERDAAYIVETAGIEPGATILDIGSGSGHLAVALGKLGFHVTGVDNALPQVLRASERLAEAPDLQDRVAFMHGDMRALPTDEQFDLVTCIGTTFGYFEEDVNRQVLEHLYEHVRPGGRLVLQVINRDHLVSRLPVRSWWQGRGCMVLDEAEMNFFANRLRVHRTVAFEDGRQYEHYMFIRAYTLHDIGKLVSSTGLSVREVAGSRHTPGRFFGATSPDIWIFAERPAAGVEDG